MRNKTISENIQKCQNIPFLHFLFYIAIISDITKVLRQGGKLR